MLHERNDKESGDGISFLDNKESDSLYEGSDSDDSESTESSHSTSVSETESIGNEYNRKKPPSKQHRCCMLWLFFLFS